MVGQGRSNTQCDMQAGKPGRVAMCWMMQTRAAALPQAPTPAGGGRRRPYLPAPPALRSRPPASVLVPLGCCALAAPSSASSSASTAARRTIIAALSCKAPGCVERLVRLAARRPSTRCKGARLPAHTGSFKTRVFRLAVLQKCERRSKTPRCPPGPAAAGGHVAAAGVAARAHSAARVNPGFQGAAARENDVLPVAAYVSAGSEATQHHLAAPCAC